MLDYRHETFLTLCRIGSFTRAAEALNITQPAVSQHIRYLEEQYGGKLFFYENKRLLLTERGQLLKKYAETVAADSGHLQELLRTETLEQVHLSFGATLTIGEYLMPEILSRLAKEKPGLQVSMQVNNTETLLRKLGAGEISFALIEGVFDKSQYGWKLFSKEEFVGVQGSRVDGLPIAGENPAPNRLEDLFCNRLIVREQGSGTRDVLEQGLAEKNFSISAFSGIWEVGNLKVIKHLVAEGYGITFLYRIAVAEELQQGKLQELRLPEMELQREFNFVYLKNSLHEAEYMEWYEQMKGRSGKASAQSARK